MTACELTNNAKQSAEYLILVLWRKGELVLSSVLICEHVEQGPLGGTDAPRRKVLLSDVSKCVCQQNSLISRIDRILSGLVLKQTPTCIQNLISKMSAFLGHICFYRFLIQILFMAFFLFSKIGKTAVNP